MKASALALAACLAVPAASFAQENTSLAEQAEKTKKDREKKKDSQPSGPAKLYTNDDLRTAHGNVIVLGGAPASSVAAPAAGASASVPASREPTEEELRAQKRADLQAQLDAQLDLVKRLRESVNEIQTELNDLSNYMYGGRRFYLRQTLEGRQKQIAEAEQAISDLDEQARRAGVSLSRP